MEDQGRTPRGRTKQGQLKDFLLNFDASTLDLLKILLFYCSSQVKLMCSYCQKHQEEEVPDPYYGGQKGFDKVRRDFVWIIKKLPSLKREFLLSQVLDILEDACSYLLDAIIS